MCSLVFLSLQLYYDLLVLLQIFDGNTDRHSIVYHQFTRPFTAVYVRIYPRTWYGWISMRAEIYGCSGIELYLPFTWGTVAKQTCDKFWTLKRLNKKRLVSI